MHTLHQASTPLLSQLLLSTLCARMNDGSLTSVDLTQFCLDRIAADNPRLHAFIEVFAEEALTAATRLDAERAAGAVRGPLHGIPVAIKDLADVAGSITTFGSRAYGSTPAKTNATCVQRLVDAGMVVLGKLHMVEFALGSWGTNAAMGTPINPHDTETQRVAGGSSSGSGVAVASGMVPCALGSDTGGSIRIPSALCGIVGLKTTSGLIDKTGVAPLSQTLDTIGPMTNTVDDARLLLEALTGTAHANAPTNLAATSAGIVDPGLLEPLDPEIEDAFIEALTKLRNAGMGTESLTLPLPPSDYQHLNGTIMNYEGFANVGHLVTNFTHPMDPFVRMRMLSGSKVTRQEYAEALGHRKIAIQDFRQRIAHLDVILLPTTAIPASPLRDVDETHMPMSRFTRWANYLDLCGISIPMGQTHNGLPIGLQILGAGGSEAKILNFASAIECLLNTAS